MQSKIIIVSLIITGIYLATRLLVEEDVMHEPAAAVDALGLEAQKSVAAQSTGIRELLASDSGDSTFDDPSQVIQDPSDKTGASAIVLNPEVQNLISVLSDNNSPGERIQSIERLATIGGDVVADAITMALYDTDATVRKTAIGAIGKMGNTKIHLLGQVMFNEPDPALRQLALMFIANIGGPAAKSLIESALDDQNAEVRQSAQYFLDTWPEAENFADGELEPTTTDPTPQGDVASSIRMQLERPEPAERIAAIQQIYGLDNNAAVAMLQQVLAQDPDSEVREAAVVALLNIGGEQTTAALTFALNDESVIVRSRVVEALVAEADATLQLLGRVLLGDPDPVLRRRALDGIATVNNLVAESFLELGTKDPDEDVRRAAMNYLGY